MRSLKVLRRFGTQLLFVLVLVGCAATLLPALPVPLERDEGEYALAARLLERGGLPYRDQFMQKPPGVVLAYRAVFLTLGRDATAIHLALLVVHLTTATLLCGLGRKMAGEAGGLFAALLFCLSLFTPLYEAMVANTEAFMLVPLVAAMSLLWSLYARSRHGAVSPRAELAWVAAIGLGLGMATLCKQVALYHLPHVGLCLLALGGGWRRGAARLVTMAAGAALPWLACLAWYAAAGAAGAFLDGVLWHNLEYVRGGGEGSALALLRLRLAAFTWFDAATWVAALAGLGWMIRRRRWWSVLFAGGWLAAACLGLSAGGYFRGHYLIQALPPVCLAAAWLLAGAGEDSVIARPRRIRTSSRLAAAVALTVLVLGLWAVARPWPAGRTPAAQSFRRYQTARFLNAELIGRALRAAGARSVYVLGSEPEIHFHCDCPPLTPYVISNPLFGGFASSRRRQHEVMARLTADPPEYLVISHDEGIPLFAGSDRWLRDEVWRLARRRYAPVLLSREGRQGLSTVPPGWRPRPPRGREPGLDLLVFRRRSAAAKESARVRLGGRWALAAALRLDHHFTDGTVTDRRSGRTATLDDYLVRGVHLGLTWRRQGGMAPGEGLEPPTNRLTADRSTTELPRSVAGRGIVGGGRRPRQTPRPPLRLSLTARRCRGTA